MLLALQRVLGETESSLAAAGTAPSPPRLPLRSWRSSSWTRRESGSRSTRLITGTCLRCGGTGHVTAITPEFIGFQCEKCRAFWKKRNRDNLRPEEVTQSPSQHLKR